ncbi:uncharacterized protein L199_008003 [Kwoniella botswanensis]|uniref:uncharacterized protein n=1 Tax=Kwoniella botswanensis TaxID=1268659 RepID=UPI00315D5A40
MKFFKKLGREAVDTLDRVTDDRFKSTKGSRPTTQTMAPPPGTIVDYSRQPYDASSAYVQTAGSYGGYSPGSEGAWGGQSSPGGGYYDQRYGAYGGSQYGYQPSNGYSPQPPQGGQPYYPPPSPSVTHSPSGQSPYLPPPSPGYDQSGQNSAMCGSPAPSATLGVPSVSPAPGRRSLSAAFAASENSANLGVDTSSSYYAGAAAPSPVNFSVGTPYNTWGQPPATGHTALSQNASSSHPESVFGGASTAANTQNHTDATAARRKSTDSIASEDRSTPGGWVTTDESV